MFELFVGHYVGVAVYQGMLLDKGGLGTGPTTEKTVVTFQLLDKIVPQLGVFTGVMKLVRDELHGKNGTFQAI